MKATLEILVVAERMSQRVCSAAVDARLASRKRTSLGYFSATRADELQANAPFQTLPRRPWIEAIGIGAVGADANNGAANPRRICNSAEAPGASDQADIAPLIVRPGMLPKTAKAVRLHFASRGKHGADCQCAQKYDARI